MSHPEEEEEIGWRPRPEAVKRAQAALRRIAERGGAVQYSEAHDAARWYLRLFEPEPVDCAMCPASEATGTKLHVALDWHNAPAERLRVDYKGRIFSAAPHLDYIPLCPSCHKRYDQWKHALPSGIATA
jgi:hypothetical protein